MKKITSLFLAFTLLITLTACENNTSVSENSSESISAAESLTVSKTEQQSQTSEESTVGISEKRSVELTLLTSEPLGYYNDPICGTDSGAYTMHHPVTQTNDIYGGFLTYIDYTSKQEVYVCADSSCKHDNEHCTAFFSDSEFYTFSSFSDKGSQLFIFGDKLYYLSIPYFSDTSYSSQSLVDSNEIYEELTPALYAMNFDGTSREKVLEFKQDEVAESFAVGEGDKYLWFITKTPTAEKTKDGKMYYFHSKNRALIKFDIAEKSVTERIPLDDINGFMPEFYGVADGKFIFSCSYNPDGNLPLENYTHIGFGEMLSSEELAKQLERSKKSESVYYVLDPSDRALKEIFRLKYDDYSKVSHVTVFGDDICFMTGENTGFKFNAATKERSEISDLKSEPCFFAFPTSPLFENEENDICGVLCETGDKALVCREKRGEEYDGRKPVFDYMLISREDLKNGVPNYENIKTIGEWL